MPEPKAGFAPPRIDPERRALGKKLQQAREYVGLNQEDVAGQLEIPRTALSNIENGSRKVEVSELIWLARLYQRPLTWFTDSEEVPSLEFPDDVRHVARQAAELSDQDRRELAAFADFLRSRAQSKGEGHG